MAEHGDATPLLPSHGREAIGNGNHSRWRWLLDYPHQRKVKRETAAGPPSGLRALRLSMARFLEGPFMQYFLLALLVLDVLVLVVELGIMEASCESGKKKSDHTFHIIEQVLRYVTLSILSIFAFELLLLLLALGLDFLKHPLYIVEVAIIATAFVLEIGLRHLQAISGLLVIFRLWRLLRLVHGVITAQQDLHRNTKQNLEESRARVHELEQEVERLRRRGSLRG